MPPARIEIRSSIQLLVEGKDTENFFKELVRRLSLPGVEVQDFGGVDQLRGFLAAFVVAPNFGMVRSIGVVRDAKQSAEAAFQSVRDSLDLPVHQTCAAGFRGCLARMRFGSASASRSSPTTSRLASARSPMPASSPSTNSTVA